MCSDKMEDSCIERVFRANPRKPCAIVVLLVGERCAERARRKPKLKPEIKLPVIVIVCKKGGG